ncbi:MAG: hypothetical protein IJS40_00110 [Synergistaceae bacterium]|nr:hypothetical protein [Synergistaceae bacterium]
MKKDLPDGFPRICLVHGPIIAAVTDAAFFPPKNDENKSAEKCSGIILPSTWVGVELDKVKEFCPSPMAFLYRQKGILAAVLRMDIRVTDWIIDKSNRFKQFMKKMGGKYHGKKNK